jgi:hypothetical protein
MATSGLDWSRRTTALAGKQAEKGSHGFWCILEILEESREAIMKDDAAKKEK